MYKVYIENDQLVFKDYEKGNNLNTIFELKKDVAKELIAYLKENNTSITNPVHAKLIFEKDADKAQVIENKGDGKDYGVSFVIEEEQSKQEYKIFMFLTLFTVAFGLLLILFLKKLKKLTHGAEDKEGTIHEESEGFELADRTE